MSNFTNDQFDKMIAEIENLKRENANLHHQIAEASEVNAKSMENLRADIDKVKIKKETTDVNSRQIKRHKLLSICNLKDYIVSEKELIKLVTEHADTT